MKKNLECYSRLLVDNHITDLKPEFMSRYSAGEYVRMVQTAGVESALVYACDHNGNCYYPTKVGHIHANIKGDNFGETVRLLLEKNIVPVAYYTAIYHNDCAKRFPHTRIIDNVGADHDGRYHFTCPNQPDAEQFYCSQIREILQYPVAGLFIDMTFWPSICCCDACRKAFGEPLPEMIDWDSPKWVRFQRFRENSLAAFARRLTDFAKSVKPGITVVHQFSPVLHGWYLGQNSGIPAASDYASGDFYGSKLQQRFAVKAFDAYTKHPPFEFMTSRCVNLQDHTSSKSDEELFLSALTTLANGGAYFFIDAINPDGTLEESFYRRLGKINHRLSPFRKCVGEFGGRISAETAVYFSINSCVDRHLNGLKFASFDGGRANNMQSRKNAVMDECLGMADVLNRLHIPWKILTDNSADFSGLKTVIIINAEYLSPEECARLRKFVEDGGTLIATGGTSLHDLSGESNGNFMLSDVFGIDFSGKRSCGITYTGAERVLAEGEVPLVTAHRDTVVRSFLTFPDFPPFDPECYASIHSNPPSAHASDFPAVTLHGYGRGRVLWIAAPIMLKRSHTQLEFMKKIFREFLPEFIVSSENLPESAEITVLKNREGENLLCIVNLQDDFPVISLSDIILSIRIPYKPDKIIRVSDQSSLSFDWENGILSFGIEKLHYGDFFKIVKKETYNE